MTLDVVLLFQPFKIELEATCKPAHQTQRAHSLEPTSFNGLKLIIPLLIVWRSSDIVKPRPEQIPESKAVDRLDKVRPSSIWVIPNDLAVSSIRRRFNS